MMRTIINITKIYCCYHPRGSDHYKNPRTVNSFNSKDKNIDTSIVGESAYGDIMKLQIKVEI